MKKFLSALAPFCFLVAVTSLPAQDWAKARLEKSPRHLEWIKVKNGEREVNCYIAFPEVKDKAPVVLVIHEIFGLSDWVRGVTDQLAEAGYIAIAPDLLSGAGPGGGGTAELGSAEAVRKAIQSLPPDQVTGDLNAAAEYGLERQSANGKLAVAGFCWGGAQTFRFATNNKKVKAAFVFYGDAPAGDALERIQCPVYGFYAGNDARITSSVPDTTGKMKKAGRTYEPVIYEGAGHGFMRAGEEPKAQPDNKKARNDAWKRWKDLLQKL